MTWIAACNGQRGTYQETIMTDEERQELCEWLRDSSTGWSGSSKLSQAADEIERLAESLKASHGYSDECEAKIKFLHDEIEARLEALERM